MSSTYTGDASAVSNSLAATITGATNASPIVIATSAAHGYDTHDEIEIAGVLGNTAANGTWTITKVSSTTFSLNGSTGNGAYTSGGTATDVSLTPQFTIPDDGDDLSAASVNVALEALADRTQFLAKAMRAAPQRADAFTANGTWTCPANVTEVLLEMWGGGGGGAGASQSGTAAGQSGTGGGGGGGAQKFVTRVAVTPGTVYAVTIGGGGVGGGGSASGDDGADTTFGSLATARGGGGGRAQATLDSADARAFPGGRSVRAASLPNYATKFVTIAPTDAQVHPYLVAPRAPGEGGAGVSWAATNSMGSLGAFDGASSARYAGGTGGGFGGANSGYYGGGPGGGGGAGPGGVGGNGGTGGTGQTGTAGNGANGASAAANTGAGGGGGGSGGNGSTSGGTAGLGGNGGSGFCRVIYFGDQAVTT